jgi:hypothetical protein
MTARAQAPADPRLDMMQRCLVMAYKFFDHADYKLSWVVVQFITEYVQFLKQKAVLTVRQR